MWTVQNVLVSQGKACLRLRFVKVLYFALAVDDGSMFEEVEKNEDILTIGLVGEYEQYYSSLKEYS
jgi:hypothetical protein